jgi:hypothetical protein
MSTLNKVLILQGPQVPDDRWKVLRMIKDVIMRKSESPRCLSRYGTTIADPLRKSGVEACIGIGVGTAPGAEKFTGSRLK